MSEHKPNETGLHCSCGLPVYGNNEHVQRLFVDLAAAQARADDWKVHYDNAEQRLKEAQEFRVSLEEAIEVAEHRAEVCTRLAAGAQKQIEAAEQRVAGLMDALQLVQDEITSAGETGTEIAISDGEHQIIRAALATEPTAAELSHAPKRSAPECPLCHVSARKHGVLGPEPCA